MMNIRIWLVLIINTLLITIIVALSTMFYGHFQDALDERVLLQLSSIRRLKKVQIEDLLQREWKSFLNATEHSPSESDSTIISTLLQNHQQTGIYDLTSIDPNHRLLIAFLHQEKQQVRLLDYEEIEHILMERTGMGNSGETYIVGSDFRLRSASRFFPDRKPSEIIAQTPGVIQGLSNKVGYGKFPDYRGVEVYSSYSPINIGNSTFVILSEIDVEEAMLPVQDMLHKLAIITIIIVLTAIIVSLYLAKIISKPILKIQKSLNNMALGDYSISQVPSEYPTEINEIFRALTDLQYSLTGAVEFSSKVGAMNLDATYTPKSPNDLLGHSLIKMKDELMKYREQEHKQSLGIKKMLMEKQEEERKRLAMELHDDIGPLLTSLKLYVQNYVEPLQVKSKIKALLDDTIAEVRLISYSLAPASLIDLGVGNTLNDFVFKIRQNTDIDISFEDLTYQEKSNISTTLGINIFRICQELINNTLKHAKASKAVITLSEFDDHISLFYYDNGIGYDVSSVSNTGTGLINIRERVALFNGFIEVSSQKGNTTVEIEIATTYETD